VKNRISVHITDDGLNKALIDLKVHSEEEAYKAVADCALWLAGESARRAPIETGDLRDNCTATIGGEVIYKKRQVQKQPVFQRTGDQKPMAVVGYSLPYALRQHEDLTLRHDRTDGKLDAKGRPHNMVAGGEAKFLERPFYEGLPRFKKRMEDALTKLMSGP